MIGPDGTTVLLTGENGGSGDNYGSACSPAASRTTFDGAAQNYIAHFSAPFTGTFRPEGNLAAFNGKSGAAANGTWKLRITDTTQFDTGALQCWSVNVNQGTALGVVNDFNGNGTSDLAVFRPATGQWFINGVGSPIFGGSRNIPVPADYDGSGGADIAVFQPATGQWFFHSMAPSVQFGRSGDVPVPADYDGDTKADIAVYRTTDSNVGVWYLNIPGQNPVAWGVRGDIPMPGDYDGDGRADVGFTGRRPRRGSSPTPPPASRPAAALAMACPATSRFAPTSTTTGSWISCSSVPRPARGSGPDELRAGFLAVRVARRHSDRAGSRR